MAFTGTTKETPLDPRKETESGEFPKRIKVLFGKKLYPFTTTVV